MVKRAAHLARLTLAVLSLTMLFAGQVAWAEAPAPHSPIPQSLLLKFLADNAVFTLVDARSPGEFTTSHITGAINIPHDSPDDTLTLLPPDLSVPIIIYCKTGKRAGQLKTKVIERGYTDVRVLLPEQIVWFDSMAVFNCGTPAGNQPDRTIESLIVEQKREGKQ